MFQDNRVKMIFAILLVVLLITTTITLTNLDDDDSELVTDVGESKYTVAPGSVFEGGQLQSQTKQTQSEKNPG